MRQMVGIKKGASAPKVVVKIHAGPVKGMDTEPDDDNAGGPSDDDADNEVNGGGDVTCPNCGCEFNPDTDQVKGYDEGQPSDDAAGHSGSLADAVKAAMGAK